MEIPGGAHWNVASSYAVLRFTLGTSFLLHGVSRLVSGWSALAEQMVQSFQNTFLPEFLVRPFALSVPPVEAVLGTFTRVTVPAPRCEVEVRARLAASIRRLPADSATPWLGRP
jgi:hypothetical protein